MASAMLIPVIPIFIVEVLNEGADKLGIVIALASFLSYFLRYFAGVLADRYQAVKLLMLIGYFVSAICKPLFYWSTSWHSVALLRSTERLGKAIRTAPKDLLIAHYSANKHSGRNFGFHKMMDVSGEMIGILIVSILFFLYSHQEYLIRNLFLATAVPGTIAVLIMAFFVDDISASPICITKDDYAKNSETNLPDESNESNESKIISEKLLPAKSLLKKNAKAINSNPFKNRLKLSQRFSAKDRQLIAPMSFYLVFSFFIFEESFLVLHSLELGFSLGLIPILILVNRFSQASVSYYIGLLIDKEHSFRMLIGSYFIGILSLACFITRQPIMSWVGFILYGLYSVITLNILRALIAEKAEKKGELFGVLYAGMAIVLSLSALFFGFVWEHYGSQHGLVIAFSGCLLLWFISLFSSLKREPKKRA